LKTKWEWLLAWTVNAEGIVQEHIIITIIIIVINIVIAASLVQLVLSAHF